MPYRDSRRLVAGEPALLRYVRNNPADVIAPTRVVRDDDEALMLYLAVGTPIKVQGTRDGQPLTRGTPLLEREGMIAGLADREWTTNHVLKILRPRRMSAIWLFWKDPEWAFRGYYGNIQAPFRRTDLGVDTADYLLDVEIDVDLNWKWKDQEEWDEAWEHQLLDPALLEEVRTEGERIIAEVVASAWPFDRSMESWRPDPSWLVPVLPNGWDTDLVYPR